MLAIGPLVDSLTSAHVSNMKEQATNNNTVLPLTMSVSVSAF